MFSETGSTRPGPATTKVSAGPVMRFLALSAARERREARAIEMAIVKATTEIRRTDFLLNLFIRMLQRKSSPVAMRSESHPAESRIAPTIPEKLPPPDASSRFGRFRFGQCDRQS